MRYYAELFLDGVAAITALAFAYAGAALYFTKSSGQPFYAAATLALTWAAYRIISRTMEHTHGQG